MAYDIKHHPRGKFIIMNNEYFAKKTEREGSKYDVINLEGLAEQLEFEAITKNKERGLSYNNLEGQVCFDLLGFGLVFQEAMNKSLNRVDFVFKLWSDDLFLLHVSY